MHTPDTPCATLGFFELEIEMRHGMYELKRDRSLWRKALSEAHVVEAEAARIVLEFSGMLRLIIEEEADCARIVPVLIGSADQENRAAQSEPGAIGSRPNWLSLMLPTFAGRSGIRWRRAVFSRRSARQSTADRGPSEPGVGPRAQLREDSRGHPLAPRGLPGAHLFSTTFVRHLGGYLGAGFRHRLFSHGIFHAVGSSESRPIRFPRRSGLGEQRTAVKRRHVSEHGLGRQSSNCHTTFYEGLVPGRAGWQRHRLRKARDRAARGHSRGGALVPGLARHPDDTLRQATLLELGVRSIALSRTASCYRKVPRPGNLFHGLH